MRCFCLNDVKTDVKHVISFTFLKMNLNLSRVGGEQAMVQKMGHASDRWID